MKIKDLPRSGSSKQADLITVVQNGVTKTVTKKVLTRDLEMAISKVSKQVINIAAMVRKEVVTKSDLNFSSPVMGKDPVNSSHLATKRYVDTNLTNTLKNDGTTKIDQPLAYRVSPTAFRGNELVDKTFVDNQLKSVLKRISKIKGDSGYPTAKAGETFIIQENQVTFAEDGPEIQVGDILICTEDSEGGRHGAVGHQFAIVNTNVVFATTSTAGILRAASSQEVVDLTSEASALTPAAYKKALEVGSEYNRTSVETATYFLKEEERGTIGVDCRKNTVTLTLPSIGRVGNAKILKYLIKDEYNHSLKNNITIVASGGDTIQGSRTYLINSNSASVKLYNNGKDKWYLESNVSSGSEGSAGVKSFLTDNITTGERATTTGAYESVMSVDVDLREYPIGTGFKVVSHCFTAANSNTKTVAIGLNGAQVLASSLTGTTAPNAKFIHHEVTFMHTDTAAYFAFGTIHMTQDDSAAGLTNNIEMDWDTTIKVSVDVLAATAATDVNVYVLQVIPLK